MAIVAVVVAVVFMVLTGVACGLLLKAVGEVMQLRKEKAGLQAEVAKHRRWLADAEEIREGRRKDLVNARDLLDAVEKEKNARIAELEASLAGMDKLCEANRQDWVAARNRCGVLEVELAGQKDIARGLVSQIAKQAQEEKALREAFARQEVAMKEAIQKEFDVAARAGSALKAARDEAASAKRLVASLHEAIAERNQTVDRKIGENETLRRLLAQQSDAVRKALAALSPPDELLAMLSKIADEDDPVPGADDDAA